MMKFVAIMSIIILQFLWLTPNAILVPATSLFGKILTKIAFSGARRAQFGIDVLAVNTAKGITQFDVDKICSVNDFIFFFEGNGCTQEMVGSYGLDAPNTDRSRTCPGENIKNSECWDNDEARSIALQGGFPSQSVIKVCDDPNNCSNDDFTVIEVIKKIPENETYCVNSFEQTYRDEYVVVSYVKKTDSGSLDGKVSRVFACFYG